MGASDEFDRLARIFARLQLAQDCAPYHAAVTCNVELTH